MSPKYANIVEKKTLKVEYKLYEITKYQNISMFALRKNIIIIKTLVYLLLEKIL